VSDLDKSRAFFRIIIAITMMSPKAAGHERQDRVELGHRASDNPALPMGLMGLQILGIR
jgi:hypothetical protein